MMNLRTIRSRILLLLAPVILAGCGPDQLHLKTVLLNAEGNTLLKVQKTQDALDKYLQALQYNPFLEQLHLNLGLTFEFMQQAEKAMSSYKKAEKIALQKQDWEVVFMARFNQAQLLGKAKKVDEALEIYQKALEIIPSSKEVKINIELLTAQGGGGGEGKDKDQKDKNQQQQQQQNQQNKDNKDGKDNKDQKDKPDQDKDGKKDQQYQNNAKYKPRPFDAKELSEGDVKKILGEIKQQESKIRADYNRKDVKEQPRDKDW